VIVTLEERQISEVGFHNGSDILFEPHKSKSIHWSVPWSDLMMTMFILFVVLFAYHVSQQGLFPTKNLTNVDYEASQSKELERERLTPVKTPSDMSELFQVSKRTLSAENLQDIASVELIKDSAVIIVLTSDVLFDSGRAELKMENMQSLRKVAVVIKDTPYVVNVIGHTDDIPISNDKFSSNWELSTARACVTAKFLIDETGIAPTRIYAAGHAEYSPIRSNHSPEGRAGNRRVEIIISKEKPFMISDRLSPSKDWE
jgi:flagellar motor protein MotB